MSWRRRSASRNRRKKKSCSGRSREGPQERETHFQREEQECLEVERLEERHERTRRTEASDKKTVDQRNGDMGLQGNSLWMNSSVYTSKYDKFSRSEEPEASTHVVTSDQSKVTVDSTPSL